MKISDLEKIVDKINSSNKFLFMTKGNSMYPEIKDGEKVYIEKFNEKLASGDIVLFYVREGENIILVLHRIIKIFNDKLFLTKGDNNEYFDKPVRINNIIGKYSKTK